MGISTAQQGNLNDNEWLCRFLLIDNTSLASPSFNVTLIYVIYGRDWVLYYNIRADTGKAKLRAFICSDTVVHLVIAYTVFYYSTV